MNRLGLEKKPLSTLRQAQGERRFPVQVSGIEVDGEARSSMARSGKPCSFLVEKP